MDDLRQRLEQALADSYRIERELGGGGMSRTYLATETALDRRVVIKVLAPELLAGISVERFRREVLLAAKLQHPHVVPVHSAGELDGIPWFTMPYVEGESLRIRLDKGSIPLVEAVSILRDVARALSYAHGHGIVHRDIKPDNVLLSSGSATVTDFGIAKAINAARTGAAGGSGATLTQVGTSIGTPTYMAPEQAAGDPDTDHRADIYAFGVMAYELIVGRPPFQASTPTKLLAAHMGERPEDLLAVRPDCPAPLADLVMRCLEKDPDDRPQEAREMARVLDTITTSGTGATVPEILRGGRVPLGRAIALWAVATVLVVVTAWAAREAIGLPDWVLPGAVGVMLAGLPIVAATAYVQRATHRAFTMTPNRTPTAQGTMATLALKASPHLSWKRAWTGGALAVGGFAVLVVGFMVMRALGIGPMGSLQGKGVFGAQETLVVADFRSPAEDSLLGMTAAEALRTDLAQSPSLRVLTRATLREVLDLMERPRESRIPYELAREIATREGAKAVLDGDIVKLGQGYVISASLIASLDGRELVSFRETADNEDGLIAALGKLSRSVRERIGEPLKGLQETKDLERVTTGSLAALKKYVEGDRVASEDGDAAAGLTLLREAVAIDSTFAMAWRKIAVLLSNMGREPEARLAAITTAYHLRGRLTELERLLTEAYYFAAGPERDRAKSLAAYDGVLAIDSMSGTALNNSSLSLEALHRYDEAEDRYRRVVVLPRAFTVGFTNLLEVQLRNGRIAAMDTTLALFRERLPGNPAIPYAEWLVAMGRGDLASADSISRATYTDATLPDAKMGAAFQLAGTLELEGRLEESREWSRRARGEQVRLEDRPSTRLLAGLDSVSSEVSHGDAVRARAQLERALARVPIESLPAMERPWGYLAYLSGLTRDPALAREALAGWERDQAANSLQPEGERAFYEAMVAMSEERWRDLVTHAEDSYRQFALRERQAATLRGIAFDQMGMTDSALAAFDLFRTTRSPDGRVGDDAAWRPRILVRTGELREAAGDRAGAIEVYAEFVDLWKDADPRFQPRVREIRQRISRLQGEIG
jgi:tetratricopeptide (TPR) repeat protein